MSCGCAEPFVGLSVAGTYAGNASLLFMTLLNTLIRDKCEVSQICERVRPKTEPDDTYDFIVVGGGSTGAVVAGRLAEVPDYKVLVLEAGDDEPAASQVPSLLSNFIGDPRMGWVYQLEPEPEACLGKKEGRCSWPRAKVLGGCGVINGMMYARGTKTDYDNWEAAGNPGWSYDDLLPIFKKSEDNQQIGELVEEEYHAVGGPMSVERFHNQPETAPDILKAAEELGYPVTDDLNGKDFVGFAVAQAATKAGTRVSSAKAFLRPQRDNPNLHVMLNSTVAKVLINSDESGKSIKGVEFIYNNITYTVGATKGVIVSGGTINSPQILLLSGIGPQKDLEEVDIEQVHELPGVGQNLHNHVSFTVSFVMNNRLDQIDLDWEQVADYLKYQNGTLSSSGMSQITARLNTKYADSSNTNPDLQLFFGGYLAEGAITGETGALGNNDPNARRTVSVSPVNLHPKSRGYLTLRSNDPLDPPLIYAGYLKDADDIPVLIEGVRVAQQLANSTAFGVKYGLELIKDDYGDCETNYTYDSDEFWSCAIRYSTKPENHQAGSCKMGPANDTLAVVDENLQVHGIEGLYVMDASIMPVVVSGNTHATCVLIGEKGAQGIIDKYSKKQ